MSHAAINVSRRQRGVVLAVAFLGWMFAGLEISMFTLITRPLIFDLLGPESKSFLDHQAKTWLAWYQTAFLLGAATGGWGFGWLGDRIGRAKALGLSICTYSLVTGGGWFATTPEQLLVVRFVSCLGIGGTWPNAVSLVAEAWPNVSRPALAGILGAAANFGFVLLGFDRLLPRHRAGVVAVDAAGRRGAGGNRRLRAGLASRVASLATQGRRFDGVPMLGPCVRSFRRRCCDGRWSAFCSARCPSWERP